MREFVVNNYITLKLEKGKTVIYVNNMPFDQCKFLLLTIPVDKVEPLDEIESIDEAAEKLDSSLEVFDEKPRDIKIPPEVEFWGHCSNLQVWAEHDYNTRLLHSNLAFPLLKELADVGDPQAKKAFKKEIAKRFLQGSKSTITYLLECNYLSYLNRDELWSLFPKEGSFLEHLEKKLNGTFDTKINFKALSFPHNSAMGVGISIHKRIKEIWINNHAIDSDCLEYISQNYKSLKLLKHLSLINNEIQRLPEAFGNLKMLESLFMLQNNLIRIPESFGNLIHLKVLDLSHNRLKTLPETIENLTSLKRLFLEYNQLRRLPESIGNLKNLKSLNLIANKLTYLPDSIGNLKSLKFLSLSKNPLTEMPNYICDFPSLKYLTLDSVQIESFPNVIETLERKNVIINII